MLIMLVQENCWGRITLLSRIFQRGYTEAQNGYTFCMLLGYGPLTCRFQAQLWYAEFKAVKLETCKLGGSYLVSRGVNLTFWAAICCIWPASAPNPVKCFEALSINKDHCKKDGAKILSGWQDMQINVPFPLESTHLGYRCTTCACSPVILYTGRHV